MSKQINIIKQILQNEGLSIDLLKEMIRHQSQLTLTSNTTKDKCTCIITLDSMHVIASVRATIIILGVLEYINDCPYLVQELDIL